MLEPGHQRDLRVGAGIDRDLGAEQRRVDVGGGRESVDRPDEDRRPDARRRPERQVAHLLEARGSLGDPVRQRDPELRGVQERLGAERELRVRHPASRGHQVELPRSHDDLGADAVPVQDLAGDRPRHGLQAGVRVGEYPHVDVLRAELVEEAPRAHQRQAALRERAADLHRADAAERHLARRVQLDHRSVGRDQVAELGHGSSLEVRHDHHPKVGPHTRGGLARLHTVSVKEPFERVVADARAHGAARLPRGRRAASTPTTRGRRRSSPPCAPIRTCPRTRTSRPGW